jgi:hypothetical protein
MDVFNLNLLALLSFIIFDCSSMIYAYDFQCLTCDNFIDGPGCGEFTKQIPVRTCRTYCYFAIVQNRTRSLSTNNRNQLDTLMFTRAIRDCSPYDDMSIEGNILLESKLGAHSSSIDIVTLKRCNSEQCNNDFYLKVDEFRLNRSLSLCSTSVPLLCFLTMSIFSFVNMF